MIVKEFKREIKTHREKLMQGHRVKAMLDKMQSVAGVLTKTYKAGVNRLLRKLLSPWLPFRTPVP